MQRSGAERIVAPERRARRGMVRAALLASSALIAVALPAAAQDATWLQTPGSGDFNTGTNWSTGTVPTGTALFATSDTTALSFSADTTVGGWTFNAGASSYSFTNAFGRTLQFTGAGIVNGGSASITNHNNLRFYGASTAGSANFTNGFRLVFNDASTAGSAVITNHFTLTFSDASTAGSAVITSNWRTEFLDSSTAGSATITNNQRLTFAHTSTAGSATITNNNELLLFLHTSTAGSATITNNSQVQFWGASTGGTARFINGAGGIIDLSRLDSAGITAGSIEGGGTIRLGSMNLAVGGNNLSTTFSGVLQDGGNFGGVGGSLTKTGTGTLTLSGANTYTGATTIDAGTLAVNGIMANSAITVNNGGTLAGIGTVGDVTVSSGGTFAPGSGTPGSTMSVTGNLAFQSGALYLVQINPASTSSANVSGTATLTGGTVHAVLAPGNYASRQYTILHAAGGLGGTRFSGVSVSNFAATLSYTPTDVLLNLTATLGEGTSLNQNQQNVARAINNFFNGSSALPPGFASVFGLTGGNLANALSLLSGEVATGAQRSAFDVTGQFLGLMLDPFVDGRRGIAGGGGPALGFAPEAEALPPEIARGYSDLKSPPPVAKAPLPERRWTAWGGAFGGWNKTSGDPVVGSHDLTARNAGIAAGLDYRATPDTVVGFALAGAAADWTLAQGLGGGKNNAFQAGAYAATRWGSAYLAASLAVANHWMFTDRNAAFGDHLTARFTGQSLGGRLEQGWRFGTPTMGLTPYGAVQAQAFRTPGYSETGGGFALAYDPRNATALRGEIGERFDYTALMSPDATLILRARLAWAHDWVSDHSVTAAFQTLPGAIFTVNGAAPATDFGLVSAGAELRLANGVTLLGKVDGELARHSTTYAGTGTLRVSW